MTIKILDSIIRKSSCFCALKYYICYVIIPAVQGGVGELNLLAENGDDVRAQSLELGYPDEMILHISFVGEEHYLEIYNQWLMGELENAGLAVLMVLRQIIVLRRVGMSFAQQKYTQLVEGNDQFKKQ